MIRFRNFLPLAALLVGAGVLGAPTQAHADFALEYSVNGGAFTVVNNGTDFVSVTVDGLTIQATGSATVSPGFSTLDLGVSGSYTGSTALTLVVKASITGVTTAPAPQVLDFSQTGSLKPPSSGSITEETWVNQTSTLFDTTTGLLADTGANTPNSSGSISFSGTVPYTATAQNTIKITTTGTQGGESISADNNNSITPTPEPSTGVLVFTAMPLLGLFGWVGFRMKRNLAMAA
jgi:hypothetical protein